MHTEVGVVHGDIKLSNILISGSQYVQIVWYRNYVILGSLTLFMKLKKIVFMKMGLLEL